MIIFMNIPARKIILNSFITMALLISPALGYTNGQFTRYDLLPDNWNCDNEDYSFLLFGQAGDNLSNYGATQCNDTGYLNFDDALKDNYGITEYPAIYRVIEINTGYFYNCGDEGENPILNYSDCYAYVVANGYFNDIGTLQVFNNYLLPDYFNNFVGDLGANSAGIFGDLSPVLFLVAGISMGLMLLSYMIGRFKDNSKK